MIIVFFSSLRLNFDVDGSIRNVGVNAGCDHIDSVHVSGAVVGEVSFTELTTIVHSDELKQDTGQ